MRAPVAVPAYWIAAALAAASAGSAGTGPEAPAPAAAATPGAVHERVPASPDTGKRYLIYLHGRIVELQGRRALSPDFGRYEYDRILNALAALGFEVIAEVRPAGTDERFADRVAGQVRQLLRAGVPASRITVVGFSKGGGLAVATAALVAEPGVGYAVLAGCSQDHEWLARWAPLVRGRMLSIHDSSDRFQPSCAPLFARARGLAETREVELRTGLDHGLFFRPRPEWLGPLGSWAAGPAATPSRAKPPGSSGP